MTNNSSSARWSIFYALSAALLVMLWGGLVNAAEPLPARYRYLFAIDTSEALAPHRDEIARFLGQAIREGFDGWMRRNETIGFWTFKEELTRDAFPVEFWTTNQKERIAEQAERLLLQTRFARTSRLDIALVELLRVAASSEAVTIFIISDGRQPIRGTPFDARINQTYASLSRSGAAPVVITRFTAREGRFSSWAVQLLENSGAEIRLVDLASLETTPVRATSATPLAVSDSITTNTGAIRSNPPASVEKPKDPAVARQWPPPVLAKELLAPIRIAPLQFDDDDEPRKLPRPVLVVPPEPGSAIPLTAAVATPGDSKEKGKNASISVVATEPVNNVVARVPLEKSELLGEPLATKVAAATSQSAVETAGPTNGVAAGVAGRAETKSEIKSGASTTNLFIWFLKSPLATAAFAWVASHGFLFGGLALLAFSGLLLWWCWRISRAPCQASLISRGFDCGDKVHATRSQTVFR